MRQTKALAVFWILFFSIILCCGGTTVMAQNPPFPLRAPWDDNDWWQPSTYNGHPPARDNAPDNALDFNFVTSISVRNTWPYADESAAGDTGRNIRAAHAGVVTQLYSSGYGNYVRLRSTENNQYETYYAHLSDFAGVTNGTTVSAGTIIGHCGATGNASGSHLHFELRRSGAAQSINGLLLSGQAVNIDYSRLQYPVERYVGRAIQARSTPPGTEIYVDAGSNGNDNNSGTSGSPFKTLAKALSFVSPGTPRNIYCMPGYIYRAPNGRIPPRCNVRRWGGSGTVIIRKQ